MDGQWCADNRRCELPTADPPSRIAHTRCSRAFRSRTVSPSQAEQAPAELISIQNCSVVMSTSNSGPFSLSISLIG